MILRRFNPIFDLAWYNSWLTARDLKPLTAREIPGIGFIAEKDSRGIAAIFLRKVEGGLGMIDGLTTNPESSREDRFEAIDLLVEKTLRKAKALGIKNVLAWSIDKHTLMRSVRHGFSQSQFTLLTRDLSLEVQPCHLLETYSEVIQACPTRQPPPLSPIP